MLKIESGREITEPPKPADKISTQFSGLTSNHEQCFERQRELVSQFKTESEVQNSDITKLRSEIGRWKETLAHAEAEVVSLKEKNLSLNNSNMTQDATIIGLRREILLLQRKIEAGHEGAALGQLDAIKLRRELAELKGDAEELKAAVAKERTEKEAFWAQVQEETRKIQALQESNARFKEESRGLVSLVEKMRDEMKLLRASNEEALKYIMHK